MVYNATFSSHLTQYTDEAVTEMAEDGHKHVMVLACGSIKARMAVLNGSYVLTDVASAVRWGSAVSPV